MASTINAEILRVTQFIGVTDQVTIVVVLEQLCVAGRISQFDQVTAAVVFVTCFVAFWLTNPDRQTQAVKFVRKAATTGVGRMAGAVIQIPLEFIVVDVLAINFVAPVTQAACIRTDMRPFEVITEARLKRTLLNQVLLVAEVLGMPHFIK